MISFLPIADGEGNHAEHGGGVTGAGALDPSTIESSFDGSPPQPSAREELG